MMLRRALIPLLVLAAGLAGAEEKTAGYVDELNFYNTDLHLVLQALNERTGHSFVEDIPVQGKVTVHISKRTPIPEVLDQILRGLNLSWRLVGGVYHVGLKLPVKGAPLGKGLLARTYELRNVPADQAAEAVRSLLSEYGKVAVDLGLNTITVTDIPEIHDNVKVKLDGVDTAPDKPRINIRAKILQIETEDMSVTDNSLLWAKYNAHEGLGWRGNGYLLYPVGVYSGAFTFRVGQYGLDDFSAVFRMYLDTVKINVLAEPDVTVPPDKEAKFEVGDKLAQRRGGAFEFEQVGVKMTVKPQKPNTDTGMIEISITPEVTDTTGQIGTDRDGWSTFEFLKMRKVSTVVEVPSGGTVRIGGLAYTEEVVEDEKVPILGDIPLLGVLFKYSQKRNYRNEVVILISPRVLEEIPPRCATTAGISALTASLVAGTTDVMLDWAEDVPFDNIGVVRYHVYRDVNPIINTAGLIPLSREVRGDVTSWVDMTPKRRGVNYHYAVTALDGADNEQAVSNSPAVTIPRR